MIHDFATDHEHSKDRAGDAAFWEPIYRRHFPDFETLTFEHDVARQKLGIDRIVSLPGGVEVTVDEKLRERHYPDVALEYWSSRERKTRGWVCKPVACHYFLYVWPSGQSMLIPSKLLRQAWRNHAREWIDWYAPPIEAKNRGYTTVSVGVPANVLSGALVEAMLPARPGEPATILEIPDDVAIEDLPDYLSENDGWLPEELRGEAKW